MNPINMMLMICRQYTWNGWLQIHGFCNSAWILIDSSSKEGTITKNRMEAMRRFGFNCSRVLALRECRHCTTVKRAITGREKEVAVVGIKVEGARFADTV